MLSIIIIIIIIDLYRSLKAQNNFSSKQALPRYLGTVTLYRMKDELEVDFWKTVLCLGRSFLLYWTVESSNSPPYWQQDGFAFTLAS